MASHTAKVHVLPDAEDPHTRNAETSSLPLPGRQPAVQSPPSADAPLYTLLLVIFHLSFFIWLILVLGLLSALAKPVRLLVMRRESPLKCCDLRAVLRHITIGLLTDILLMGLVGPLIFLLGMYGYGIHSLPVGITAVAEKFDAPIVIRLLEVIPWMAGRSTKAIALARANRPLAVQKLTNLQNIREAGGDSHDHAKSAELFSSLNVHNFGILDDAKAVAAATRLWSTAHAAINVDLCDSIGKTLLIEAARSCRPQLVAFLLERGANPTHM